MNFIRKMFGKKPKFDLVAHLDRQRAFSVTTFGPGRRTEGVTEHIGKELNEIRAKPDDLEEWVDVVILGFDGAWRTGAEPEEIVAALVAKQTKNEGCQWPDWRTADPDKAIEHVREKTARGEGALAHALSTPSFTPDVGYWPTRSRFE